MTARNESPAAPRKLAFGVNENRLLGEVGLFFSSATAAFAECVQNAYRAGATTLRVTADPSARKVVFRDNGCGLSDPSKLLLIAESGWDAADVKHAAGLGSLALFAIATDVEIISMPIDGGAPWRMHFTDAALRHEAPVECWDAISPALWAEHGDEPHGIEIRATLRESATFPAMTPEGSREWRHRFPLAITVEVADSCSPGGVLRSVHTVSPREGHSIETSVGTLHIATPNKQSSHYSTAIFVEWEHRSTGTVSIPDEVLTDELCVGVPNAVREELIVRLRSEVEIVWVVSLDAAVEAKLPDRETLVRNEGFKQAMSVLASTLLAEFDVENLSETFAAFTKGEAIVQLEDIDRLARGVQDFRPRFKVIPLTSFKPIPFLAMAGYRVPEGGNDLSEVDCCLIPDGDGSEFEVTYNLTRRVVKPLYVTAFADLAVDAGIPAIGTARAKHYEGLIPLSIVARGESLFVEEMQAIFARDLQFVNPDGVKVASVPVAVFESAWDDINDADVELPAGLAQDRDPIQVVFAMPEDEATSLPDAVMAFVHESQAFINYATIMAGERRGGEFALDLWDYTESSNSDSNDSWNETRLAADARRLVANAVGGKHVAQAECAAVLAELSALIDVNFIYGSRADELVGRGKANGIDPKLLARILRGRNSLRDALKAIRIQQSEGR